MKISHVRARHIAYCLLWLGIVAVHPAFAESGVTDSEIIVGSSVSASGPLGPLGAGIRDGAAAYFDHVNGQGGVAGRKIRFIALDDAYVLERTVANVKKLINEEHVFALLGVTGTPSVMATLPIARAAGIPLFGPFTGAAEVRKDFNRYLFTVTASYGEEVEKIVEQITTFGVTRVAVVYLNNSFGKSGLAAVEQAMQKRNLKILGAAPVEANSSDIKTAADAMAKLEPQVIVMATAGKVSADYIKEYKARSLNTQFYCLSVTSNTQLSAALGANIRGVVVSQTMPLPWSATSKLVTDYQRIMKSSKQTDYSYASMQGFLSAKIFVEGLRRAGRDLSREKLISSLESMSHADIDGYQINFSPTNHNGSKYVDLTVLGKDGKFIR
ncbi:MAG TPA: ABC transporter permease [Oxalobacteraceae bacterium]|nr:ABC transporter permease [Oxalobacteraceae bacterium]